MQRPNDFAHERITGAQSSGRPDAPYAKDILNGLTRLCQNNPAIIAAFLFGSRASGTHRPTSDIDLALLLDEHCSTTFDLLEFMGLAEAIAGKQVDVVILNAAGELLKHEVRKHGVLLHDPYPQCRKRFEIQGRKSFEDFLYLHKRYTQRVLYGQQAAC